MNDGIAESVALSSELLALMRNAARIAIELHEPFITVRALLLALLDEPQVGSALQRVVPREALMEYQVEPEAVTRMTAARVSEPNAPAGERGAMLRFDTLAFKLPDGSRSVWLSREAHSAFAAGALRVEEGSPYLPRHVAYGIAAEAVRGPALLTTLQIAPGAITDAIAER